MENPIFRKKALERLSSPEQLDQLMQVATPKGWLALLALAGLLVTGLIWGLFGSVPTTIQAQGILSRAGGITTVGAPAPGQVRDINVAPGDVVAAEQVVATLVQAEPDNTTSTGVTSPSTGRVVAVMAGEWEFVNQGTPLISLEPTGQNLEAVLYLPLNEGKNIQPGMEVQVSPSTVRKEEYGFLRGFVRSVADYPATSQSMKRILGTDELVEVFAAAGPAIEIHVELARDPGAPGSYQWSSSKVPPVELTSGTLCSAAIVTGRQRPIQLGQ